MRIVRRQMKKSTSLFYASVLFLFSVLCFAQDQSGYQDELLRRPFYADYAAFDDSLSNNIDIRVYYKIFSSNLTYQKWGEKFKAAYSVDVTIKHKGKQVNALSSEGNLIADDYKSTLADDDFAINAFQFSLQPENYEIIVRLNDSHSGDSYTEKQDLKLKDFDKQLPNISTIQFAREIKPIDVESSFNLGTYRIIPSVSRSFGFNEPDMQIYYQIYNKPGFKGDYLAFYEITSGTKIYLTDTTLFAGAGQLTEHFEKFDVADLLPGKYDLSLRIVSPGNKFELRTKGKFYVEWSVNAIVKNDFKTAVEQLQYVASRKQLDSLMDSAEDNRFAAWVSFWQAKDPTPGTPENELKEEYYRRIRFAEINYGHLGRDGWKTDRGMVYVTYGPADEVETHPFEFDSKPYQIWYYYNLRKRFVFVDVNGYGDFELQYPFDGDTRKLR